jgi:hypothetical protein
MSGFDHDTVKICAHRTLIEARLSKFLKQSGSTETVEEIKNLIFEGAPQDFKSYVDYLLSTFENPESTVDIDAALPVIQDAWNYFPHRFLNGRCPVEVFPSNA